MSTLFISDLHLDEARPNITALFLEFLRGEAQGADALYVLGDLFEAWLGDDDDSPLAGDVAKGLAALKGSGVPIAFQHGNRDFLVGEAFAARAGLRLMDEFEVVDLYGTPTLLLHGDQLCTQDHEYQAVRRQVRSATWRQAFLSKALDERRAFAAQAREASKAYQAGAAEIILDVHPPAVEAEFAEYGVTRMIHGHTHRPAIHDIEIDGNACQRIVLGDWYEQGSVLRVDADRLDLRSFQIASG